MPHIADNRLESKIDSIVDKDVQKLSSYKIWMKDLAPLVYDIRACMYKVDDNAFQECENILNKVPSLFANYNLDVISDVFDPVHEVFSSPGYYKNAEAVVPIDGLLRKKIGVLLEKIELLNTYLRIDINEILEHTKEITPEQKKKLEDKSRLWSDQESDKKLYDKVYGVHDVKKRLI
jgi:hypothetical protein